MDQPCIFDFGGFTRTITITFYGNKPPHEYNFPNTDWLLHSGILPFQLDITLTNKYGIPYYKINRRKIQQMLRKVEKERNQELEEHF